MICVLIAVDHSVEREGHRPQGSSLEGLGL